MHKTPFIRDYTAMTTDGARWIVDNGNIELVGIDYTSIAIYEDLKGPHLTLLPNVSHDLALTGRLQCCQPLCLKMIHQACHAAHSQGLPQEDM